jgi:2-dehydro-3-deoxygluconokinase
VTRFQVSALGEAMLRLSVRPGERLLDAPAYQVHVAGTEANVAHAAARVGLRAAWTSALPRNRLGERIASALRSAGVDVGSVVWTETGRVGTYFVELSTEPRPTSVVYDRAGSTMSLATPDQFDWEAVCDADVVHLSGITLGLSPSAREVGRRAVEEARRRGRKLSLDVNYRALLWSPEAAAQALRDLKGSFDLAVSTAEDARDLFGLEGDPADVVTGLRRELGAEIVVLTRGAEGATLLQGERLLHRPAHRVQPVDRIGAGDAFDAGLIWGWLEGDLEAGLERGLAMAALKMTLQGDLFTLDADDVHRLLRRTHREVHR